MKTFSFALLASILAVFAFACARQSNQPTADTPKTASPTASLDEFATAKAHYEKMCSECHGKTGDGGTVQVDNKRLKVPSLKAGHALTHTDQQLVKQVIDGGDGMPSFKDKLSTVEAAELVRFVRHDFQGK
jgi:mono/diheme cytochrome c family protein